MNDLIKQKIDLIATCIFDKIKKSTEEELSYGLYTGEFGTLLFSFYYSRLTNNPNHTLLTEEYAERLSNRFLLEMNLHTFCNGFAGILYLFEFLRENDFIEMDISNSQSLLENYLITRMRHDIHQQKYDFMHGALGVGLYFLKKGTNSEYIQELIHFLYQTSEKEDSNKYLKWKSVIKHENNLIGYNLSLSHGISSIIIFLSRTINCGMKDERIIEMLSGTVNYMLLQKRDFTQFGSYFPSYIINSHDPVSKSRLAWCYGDLGIGMALWQAGKTIDNSVWKEMGLEILLRSTQRQEYADTFVIDAGICHGSAGLAMIYRRMYLETGRNEFNDAANYRLNQTLSMAIFEDGYAGYKTCERDKWKCDYSLLTGIAGIGMVLVSFIAEDKQMWDEMFLIS